VTANATRVANAQGGAWGRRVTVGLYPSVAVRVGKCALNERDMAIQVMLHAADKSNVSSGSVENDILRCHVYYITFQSVSASRRIRIWLLTSV
jgi:hypothetical protein